MNIFILTVQVLFSISIILFAGVLFFSYLKYLKRTYFPTWKFPDYFSVGYAEYLYKKFIQKPLKQIKEHYANK
jgi:hypothetical protein